jgi:hypothetical protein
MAEPCGPVRTHDDADGGDSSAAVASSMSRSCLNRRTTRCRTGTSRDQSRNQGESHETTDPAATTRASAGSAQVAPFSQTVPWWDTGRKNSPQRQRNESGELPIKYAWHCCLFRDAVVESLGDPKLRDPRGGFFQLRECVWHVGSEWQRPRVERPYGCCQLVSWAAGRPLGLRLVIFVVHHLALDLPVVRGQLHRFSFRKSGCRARTLRLV